MINFYSLWLLLRLLSNIRNEKQKEVKNRRNKFKKTKQNSYALSLLMAIRFNSEKFLFHFTAHGCDHSASDGTVQWCTDFNPSACVCTWECVHTDCADCSQQLLCAESMEKRLPIGRHRSGRAKVYMRLLQCNKPKPSSARTEEDACAQNTSFCKKKRKKRMRQFSC